MQRLQALSILFSRFGDLDPAIGDSESGSQLSILFLRFSSPDACALNAPRKTFNSLFEIRGYVQGGARGEDLRFQFSF